mgnify:CR=1 FL=1|jgi:hypothetical protein
MLSQEEKKALAAEKKAAKEAAKKETVVNQTPITEIDGGKGSVIDSNQSAVDVAKQKLGDNNHSEKTQEKPEKKTRKRRTKSEIEEEAALAAKQEQAQMSELMVTPALHTINGFFSPKWQWTPKEVKQISEVIVPVLVKYLPAVLDNYGEEVALLFVLGGITLSKAVIPVKNETT